MHTEGYIDPIVRSQGGGRLQEDEGRSLESVRERAWRTASASGTVEDIPFEFVGKVASARAVAETSHVEGGTATRHDLGMLCEPCAGL